MRFRAKTKVRGPKSKNTNAESAARNTVCCVVLGLINGRSNDDSESRIANSRKLPAASMIIRRFRSLPGLIGLPEAIDQPSGRYAVASRVIIASVAGAD